MAVPPWYHAKTNFTGGEWSPDLAGRFDLPQYSNAVKVMTNWLVQPHGGAYTVPGTVMVAPVRHSDEDQVLISFEFNAEQTYALELGAGYFRFFTQNARIEEPVKTITNVADDGSGKIRVTVTSHGYSDGDPVVIRSVLGAYEANGDWLIESTTANEFTLTGSAFNSPYTSGGQVREIYEITNPYAEADLRQIRTTQNSDTMFLFHRTYPTQKVTRTGATTFSIERVLWSIAPFNDDNATAVTIDPNGTAVGTNVQIVASSGIFTTDDQGNHFRIANGVVRINTTGFVSSTQLNGVVTKTCVDAATANWAKGQWSDLQGYPSAGTFYENRLVVGKDQTIYGTKSGEFDNFDQSTPDDASFGWEYDLATKTANLIRWFASDDVLIAGTSGREFKITGSDQGGITPLSVFARPQSRHGSAEIEPAETTSGIVFVQRGQRKLRRVTFSLNDDKFIAPDLSLLANRLARTNGGMVQLAYQSEPNETLWMVRADGVLIAVTLLSEQNVNAWSKRTTPGLFKSVATTKTTFDDDVWVIVERTIGGKTTRFVEYFDPTISVDCAVKGTFGSAVSNITSGLHHLEGAEVTIVGDEATYPNQIVTQAQLPEPLDPTVTNITIGLKHENPKMEFFLPHREFADGTTVGRNLRTTTVTLRINETRGLKVGDEENFTRSTEDLMGSAPEEEQTDVRFTPNLDWNEPIIIEQTLPFRATVLAAIQHVETGD